jgi:6,7-dimethyl-8-ribityllumazine synthase
MRSSTSAALSVSGAGLRIGIVSSRFHQEIVDRLLAGAGSALDRLQVAPTDRVEVRVAGAWEIPQALEVLARSGRVDAAVAFGAVIRGETAHFDHVAQACSRGCSEVALRHALPLGFGVLTCDTVEQALARSGGEVGDLGADAIEAAVSTAREFERIRALR